MKKRAYFIALSLGLLVVSVSFTGIFADENKQVTSLVKMVNDNKLIKDPDKVVFKVNGKPVLAREFVKEKNLLIYLAKINGSAFPSEHDVINSLAKREALYQKAVELGLEATDNEVREFVKQQRSKFEEYDPNATGKELIEAEIKATGLTADEYWERTIPEYKKILTLSKLSDYYLKQLGSLNLENPNNVEKIKYF
ncbi:SurA N-terminal domain-containing protein [Carboxydocella thermautotrophica]|nr:SurA N-terminal domain-containing protein [Carboxydocella thermautotrophica]